MYIYMYMYTYILTTVMYTYLGTFALLSFRPITLALTPRPSFISPEGSDPYNNNGQVLCEF